MLRRQFLAAPLGLPLLARAPRIDRARVSAITDEIARSPADAITFIKQYGLRWVELRDVPGAKQHYATQSEEFLKQAAKEFHDSGIGISFFNTGMLKITLPGTDPKRSRPETPEVRAKRLASHQAAFERRMDDLRQAIRAAHILNVDKIRLFAFLRVDDPKTVEDRVANIIGEMAEVAHKEGIKTLLENEGSCNVATSAELAGMVNKLPAKYVGLNWDPMNGMALGEKPYPDGYNTLPKKRIWNVQIKGRTLLEDKYRLDWAAIFDQLVRDGYRGQVGLETHIFGDIQVAKSHESMREILRIVES
jgi:sugar phosphate isomerase/epimerase